MTEGRVRQLLVIVPVGVVGIAGAIAGLAGRGADDAFLLRQASPASVTTEKDDDRRPVPGRLSR
jgi:hypothetical protein